MKKALYKYTSNGDALPDVTWHVSPLQHHDQYEPEQPVSAVFPICNILGSP